VTVIAPDPRAESGALRTWWRAHPRVRRMLTRPGTILALAWLTFVIVGGVLAAQLAPHDPNAQDLLHANAGTSAGHWLGTDDLGRDVLSRILHGAAVSMQVTFEVVGIALVVALVIGLVAGYRGGWVDYVLMRLMDAGLAFPPLVLALAVVAVLGSGVDNAAIALALVFIPGFARFIRAQTLAIKEEAFVDASRSIGSTAPRIAIVRVLPNVMTTLIVQIALSLGAALLAESALSFLGLGVQPPDASWGAMLREAYDTSLFTNPWALVPSGLAIALTVLSFNTIGDGLRDSLSGAVSTRRSRRQTRQRGLTTVEVTSMPDDAPNTPPALLEVRDLAVEMDTDAGPVTIVEGVSFDVGAGRIVGLLGESGCGKSVTSMAILRLLSSPPARITAGSIKLDGRELLDLSFEQMRRLRGNDVAMVFQDPLASLDPTFTIGSQMVEAIRLHEKIDKREATRRAADLLVKVHIPDPGHCLQAYPHQLSGGMRQRVMIAMALSCHPRLLIADEPTTALDVTIQAQIVELLRELRDSEGLAVLFVTHDLELVSELCDEITVMYAGQVVEQGETAAVFAAPHHPYTAALLGSSPAAPDAARATALPGHVPTPGHLPEGCRFHPRCAYATDECAAGEVALDVVDTARTSRCLRHAELVLTGVDIAHSDDRSPRAVPT
jgi:oligopeptide/dipeptide ABC transporter ATP-binding protein